MDSLGGGGAASLGAAELGREYDLGPRRFRLLRLLGEGGYSFVYLAREVTPPGSAGPLAGGAAAAGEQRLFALKRVRWQCGAEAGDSRYLPPASCRALPSRQTFKRISPPHPQVLCGGADQLAEARHEVDVMRRLGRRPCLLPLLDAAVVEQRLEGGEARQVVLMLFPGAGRAGVCAAWAGQGALAVHAMSCSLSEAAGCLCLPCAGEHSMWPVPEALCSRPVPPAVYGGGNLFDFVQQQRQQAAAAAQHRPAAAAAAVSGGAQQRRQAQLAELRTLLQVFLQVCAALHDLHSRGLAHRDVKPQNVLLRLRQQAGGPPDGSASGAAAPAAYDPAPPIEPLGSSREEPGWEAGSWAASPSGAAAEAAGDSAPAVIAVEQESDPPSSSQRHRQQRQQQEHQHPAWGGAGGTPPEAWWASRLPAWQERYEAVLMDFGSTRSALVQVQGRQQAMAVQEDAEVRARAAWQRFQGCWQWAGCGHVCAPCPAHLPACRPPPACLCSASAPRPTAPLSCGTCPPPALSVSGGAGCCLGSA